MKLCSAISATPTARLQYRPKLLHGYAVATCRPINLRISLCVSACISSNEMDARIQPVNFSESAPRLQPAYQRL